MPKRISSSLFYCFRFESAVSIVHLEDDELFPPVGFEPISKARHSLPLGEGAHLPPVTGDIARLNRRQLLSVAFAAKAISGLFGLPS
ncbi:MAG: hypothetical protein ACYTGL_19945 [Planctomycetota bacterium]|jgi:hypothetical protein